MRCPKCGQVNPISVTRCDCGHDLQSRPGAYMEESWYSRHEGTLGCLGLVLVTVFLMWAGGCFVSFKDPVLTMQRQLRQFPEYSIIVSDIDDGFFRNTIDLKGVYRSPDSVGEDPAQAAAGDAPDPKMQNAKSVLEEIQQTATVRDSIVEKYAPFIGMVVSSKTRDGKVRGIEQAAPPYYQYVGYPRYGYWGGGYWHWYPSYSGFGTGLLIGHMISRNDYGNYVSYRNRGQSYYGRDSRGKKAFGATGTTTARARPNFVKQYNSKLSRSSSPISRSRSRSTGRSGGWFSGGK